VDVYSSTQKINSHKLNVEIEVYITAILIVVWYGCETWSLTQRGAHKMRVFENRVLRRICEPKRNKITGQWRKLFSEKPHNFYSFLNIIRLVKSRKIRGTGVKHA
jgi:hypothetical protein